MKNILLATSLLSIASVALANDLPPPAAHACGINKQHCTSFSDQLAHPTEQGYLMQHSITHRGEALGPVHEVCVNASFKLMFKARDTGHYTEFWKVGRTDENGEFYFDDYAVQTFFVREDGKVHPGKLDVFLDGTHLETNCTVNLPPPPEAETLIQLEL